MNSNIKEKNKNITIIACYFGPKLGVGVFIEKLLDVLMPELISNGYRVNLITNNNVLRNSPGLIVPLVKIVQPRLIKRSLFSKFYFLFVLPHLRIVKMSEKVLFTADSIIGFGLNQSISVVHDLNEFEFVSKFGKIRTFFRKQMIKRVMKHAEEIVVISDFVKQQVYRQFGKMKKDKRLHIIHSGITIKKDYLPATFEKEDTPYFLIVGRIDPEGKKLYESVDIFLTYKKYHPEYKLKIVGGVNKFCEIKGKQFLQYISNILDVEYLGYVSDENLDFLYKNAAATIFFSKFEGFGFPVLEAFLRGCPVITNSENEVNNELSFGKDIKISETEIKNPAAIDEKINLINQISKKELIGIAETFSWESAGKKYYKLLTSN